jgi:hypothetical protein
MFLSSQLLTAELICHMKMYTGVESACFMGNKFRAFVFSVMNVIFCCIDREYVSDFVLQIHSHCDEFTYR